MYYFNFRWIMKEAGQFLQKSPYSSNWEHPYIMNHSNPLRIVDPSGRIPQIRGGTPSQQKLVEDAYRNSCENFDCYWDPSKIPAGADPRAVNKMKNCLKKACNSDQPIIIGSPKCDEMDIQGYTNCGPLNPFCGSGGIIFMCPNYIFEGEGGGADPEVRGLLMHKLSHNCGAGEGWAYPIGDMFL